MVTWLLFFAALLTGCASPANLSSLPKEAFEAPAKPVPPTGNYTQKDVAKFIIYEDNTLNVCIGKLNTLGKIK